MLIKNTRNLLINIKNSQFLKQSILLFSFNTISRIFAFVGSALAAKSLGPFNLGLSSIIQSTAIQVNLVNNLGFDNVAIRLIAEKNVDIRDITKSIVTFRVLLAFVLILLWIPLTYLFVDKSIYFYWQVGILIIIQASININFFFLGSEKLPTQASINAIGAIGAAIIIIIFFHFPMPPASDLYVQTIFGILAAWLSWLIYHNYSNSFPIGKINFSLLKKIFVSSKYYWTIAIIIFIYTYFQFPLIAHFCGVKEAGIYRSAFLLASGVEILYGSITSLLIPRLISWKKVSYNYMWNKQILLVKIFLIIFLFSGILLFFTSDFLINNLLGSSFKDAITVFKILLIGRGIVFMGQIFAWGLTALALDKAFLLNSFIGAVTSLVLNLILLKHLGIIGAACISVTTEIIIHLLCFVKVRNFIFFESNN